jgi:DNA (cytosine-5)-methyltransferase 1
VRYLSVCSGIEAATVAWHPLGWEAAAFSEIEKFPRAVLEHHYPNTPLHGDFTTIKGDEYGPIDLLVGGTPCQSFSVAGLRGGMDDPRGNLALGFLQLARRTRARWVVWENVPGVLSSNGGRDFGAILGGLAELGYGWSYRVLDAQFFGVAQRRRRVFVVGYLGDWRRAAAVLFERHGLSGHPAPRRQAGQRPAPTISARPTGGGGLGTDLDGGLTISTREVSHCLNAGGMGWQDFESETLVAHTLKGEGFDASKDGTGRGTPLVAVDPPIAYSIMPQNSGKDYKARPVEVAQPLMAGGPVGGNQDGDFIVEPVAFDMAQITSKANRSSAEEGLPASTLSKQSRMHAAVERLAVAFALRGREGGAMLEMGGDQAGALRAASGGSTRDYIAFTTEQTPKFSADSALTLTKQSPTGGGQPQCVMTSSAVRRLTPRECERLQGFPDDYTLIPWRKGEAPDGPRYKALGNSMAVPVMAWIGRRIEAVEALQAQQAAA